MVHGRANGLRDVLARVCVLRMLRPTAPFWPLQHPECTTGKAFGAQNAAIDSVTLRSRTSLEDTPSDASSISDTLPGSEVRLHTACHVAKGGRYIRKVGLIGSESAQACLCELDLQLLQCS